MGINDWRGAAVSSPAAPDTFYIFLNADQPAEVQRRTMKHEAWHILNGDHQHPDIDDAAAEEEARRHEEDPAMDAIISKWGLWKKAVHVQRPGSPYSRFKGEGKEMYTDASGSRQTSPDKPRTGRIDGGAAAAI